LPKNGAIEDAVGRLGVESAMGTIETVVQCCVTEWGSNLTFPVGLQKML
jgi:hypothetical protein